MSANSIKKKSSLLSLMSRVNRVLIVVLLVHGCVRDDPPARIKKITKEEAIVMLSEAEWEKSLCIEGTRPGGGRIHVEKIHPKETARYAQGPFWVREPVYDGKYVRLQDEFFNDPREAIEAMAERGVSEFQECQRMSL